MSHRDVTEWASCSARLAAGLVALFLVHTLILPRTGDAQTIVMQGAGGVGGVVAGQVGPATPARDLPPERTGTSRIRGRVVASDTGVPARRAEVRLTGGGLREPRSTMTDAEGRYEFRDLPSGRYSLTASKVTYVTINYGQTRPLEPGKPIEVGENQTVEKIDFNLHRGGVIAGRILDEYGEPLVNAAVQPMQNRFMNGQQRPMPSGSSSMTSDTGEYRLWGLSPGQYFISVSPRMNVGPMSNSDDRSGYAPTYYPGTANLAEAQSITIAAGQIASGIDIMLVLARTARVSGIAIDSSGRRVSNGGVTAMQRGPGMMMGAQGGPIKPDGTFSISGLTPGEYTLRGIIPQSQPGQGQQEVLLAAVTVAGADIDGVVLAPVQPATVKGRIVFDPPAPALQSSMFRVMVSPRSPELMPVSVPTGQPVINEDFTFEAKASAGQMMIRAMTSGVVMPPPATLGPNLGPWTVKSVRYDSTDITDTGIELAWGRNLAGVEIVMTNRMQVVSGQVTNSSGALIKEGTVVIFAQDRERRIGPSRYTSLGRIDQNGKYSVRGLPPGDYFARAVEELDNQRYPGDPDYLEQLSQGAMQVTLREGETRTLDLRIR